MYTPSYTQPHEQTQIQELVEKFPFVTLISKDVEGNPYVSHIPVVTHFENGQIKYIHGHFARQNPHAKFLEKENRATLIFHGPHTYITPTWYKSGRDVPTWNYCVVHVTGSLSLNSSFDEICTNLKELVQVFESSEVNSWGFELPADLLTPEALTKAIVAFTLIPEKVEAKFKLSQNRPKVDREGVVEGLDSRSDEMSRAIQNLMKQRLS